MQLRTGPRTGYYLSAPVIAAVYESLQWKCCAHVKGRWKDGGSPAWKYLDSWMVSLPLTILNFPISLTSPAVGVTAKLLLCYGLSYLLYIRWTRFCSYMHWFRWLLKLIASLAKCKQQEKPGYGWSQNLIIKSPIQSPESWSITLIFFFPLAAKRKKEKITSKLTSYLLLALTKGVLGLLILSVPILKY